MHGKLHPTLMCKMVPAASTYSWGPRFPKSCLHEFYQVHGGQPVFTVEDGPASASSAPQFVCHLMIPAVRTPQGGFEETSFTATDRSKKGAEHSAAAQALAFLVSKGLMRPPPHTAGARPGMGRMGSGDPALQEVRLLERRVTALSAQLASEEGYGAKYRRDALQGSFTSDTSEDVDSLDPEALKAALRRAMDLNLRLKKEVALERERRKAAIDALQGAAMR